MDRQFNFVRLNRPYAEADRRPPSFFPGKNHFDLYPNEENERIFRRVVETGEPFFIRAKPFEYAQHPERGVSYWDWSLMPIKDDTGFVTGVVLSLTKYQPFGKGAAARFSREHLCRVRHLGRHNRAEAGGAPPSQLCGRRGGDGAVGSGWRGCPWPHP